MISSIKSAVGGLFLAAGLTFAGAASAAITLDTTGLKSDAVLQFSPAATSASSGAKIVFSALGNATQLADVDVYDPDIEENVTVSRFNMPVTKAKISIGWDLKITANSGESSRSALFIKRGINTIVLANFAIDFDKEIVYADVIKNGVTTSKVQIYTFDVVEPQKISFKNLVLNQSVKIGNLLFTADAQTILGDGLNLSAPLRAALASINFGDISVLVTSYKRTPKANATPFTAADVPN